MSAPKKGPIISPGGPSVHMPTIIPIVHPVIAPLDPPYFLVPKSGITRSNTKIKIATPAVSSMKFKFISTPLVRCRSSKPTHEVRGPGIIGSTLPASPSKMKNTEDPNKIISIIYNF